MRNLKRTVTAGLLAGAVALPLALSPALTPAQAAQHASMSALSPAQAANLGTGREVAAQTTGAAAPPLVFRADNTSPAYIVDGRMMVPLRALAEGLGIQINFDSLGEEVFLYNNRQSIRLRAGDDRMWINGREVQLPLKVELKDGRTYGPLRAIAAAWGAEAVWNPATRSVAIHWTQPAFGETSKLSFDFATGPENWTFGAADLPVDYDQESFQIRQEWGLVTLGEGDDERTEQGLRLSGMNRSDDLFLYVTKAIGPENGLARNTRYQVRMQFALATDVEPGLFGIGGAPGESVYVKAGVVNRKPEPVQTDEAGNAYYRLNLDKGQQAEGGKDLAVLGNVAKPENSGPGYQVKTFGQTFEATTGDDGTLYLIIGYDSGFEGLTDLYLTEVEVEITPVKK